jgi:hypothetical protein
LAKAINCLRLVIRRIFFIGVFPFVLEVGAMAKSGVFPFFYRRFNPLLRSLVNWVDVPAIELIGAVMAVNSLPREPALFDLKAIVLVVNLAWFFEENNVQLDIGVGSYGLDASAEHVNNDPDFLGFHGSCPLSSQ